MSAQWLEIDEVKRLAKEVGFDLCGVTPALHHTEAEHIFHDWLRAGYGDGLDYLSRYEEVRFDPSKLVDGAKSVIVCAVNYKSNSTLSPDLDSGTAVASYAHMRDYHKTIKQLLLKLLQKLQELYPDLGGRAFTDSAPLLEKHHAVCAGLGWIGRQSLLVTPQFGTFVLLGELVVDIEADSYDEPIEGSYDRCGSCRKCVDSCPVGAINDNRTIDASRCIAARTIEFEDVGDEPLAGWIFGCDSCQICCPHNQRTEIAQNPCMATTLKPLTSSQWLSMSEEEFTQYAQGRALRRTSLERVKGSIRKNLNIK